MRNNSLVSILITLILVVAGWLVYFSHTSQQPQPVTPNSPTPIIIPPAPRPIIIPPYPWRPWNPWRPFLDGEAHDTEATPGKPVEGGLISPDGNEEIQVNLPPTEKKKNVGGRDGAGLCVFTSIEYVARWQNEKRLFNFQSQMRQERGGGYPEKVDQMIKKYADGVPYSQYEGSDLSVLQKVMKGGRAAGVTYNGFDCHYHMSVSHMVTLAHLTSTWAAITDNNFPADNQIVWMSPEEFKKRWTGGRSGWAVFLHAPPPPPVPHN